MSPTPRRRAINDWIKLDSLITYIIKTKVTGSFKNNIQGNIDDLELAIHNLKMLENES